MSPKPWGAMLVGAAAAAAVALIAGFALGSSSHSGATARVRASVTVPTVVTHNPAATSPTDRGPGPSGPAAGPSAALPPEATVSGLPDLVCPAATVRVHDAAGLQAALAAARPATVIGLTDGVYYGRFTGTGSGTASEPIWVCGSASAIIDDSRDGGTTGSSGSGPGARSAPPQTQGHYGFHLLNASWWRLVGFSVRNAQKGVVLDRSDHNVLHGLRVFDIGDEAIHLRDFSTDNVVEGCVVRTTGLRVAKYGEGIYVGTAVKNWTTYSGGQADGSNRNVLRYNDLSRTTAENIDIKEGTSAGEIAFNHLDGTGLDLAAATSLVNVKGNGWSVHDNTAANSPGDGFSTHRIVSGSGEQNVFSANHIGTGVSGYGFAFHSKHNTLKCDNTGQGDRGQANVSCTQ